MNNANAAQMEVGNVVVNKYGTKGEVTFVHTFGGFVIVKEAGRQVTYKAADLTKACCNGASRDCAVHGDGN